MRKFLWINPVSTQMYASLRLEEQLLQKGFELVYCTQDHIAAVKAKYRNAVNQAQHCVADMRCAMAVHYIKENYNPVYLEYPEIEPILIHCARELHTRLAAKGELYITTPCTSLRDLGNALSLPGVHFYTWKEFVEQEELVLMKQTLESSPIPPGFFAEYGEQVKILDSKEKLDQHFTSLGKIHKPRIIEMLYCSAGCHGGDGV